MFKTKWRIRTDSYLGYEVQKKLWFWPFWYMPVSNTYQSLPVAKAALNSMKKAVVYVE